MSEPKRNKQRYTLQKQLLTSILGTAIGVGLTFFASNQVEKKHQQAAQRETAIMAVCDIDEIVQGLKEEIAIEDSLFKVAMYVSSHREMIGSFPMDTLNMAFIYLYDDPTTFNGWTADTKENAFNSGIDARMNIGNNQFYDNVQLCYYLRRSLKQVMAEAPLFTRPISKEDYEEFLQKLPPDDIDYYGLPSLEAKRNMMKKFVARGATSLYLKRYFSRRQSYNQVINELERLNSENKLLMEITDEDIDAYIKRNTANVSGQDPAKLIVGTWELNLNETRNTYVFNEDNTFERTMSIESHLQIKLEQEQKEVFLLAPMDIYITGQWELDSNTLITMNDYSKSEIRSFDLDVSSLPQSALERIQDSLEIKKEWMKESLLDMMRQQNPRYECVISFDKSGNTMIWTEEETTPTGQKQTNSTQLYRK